MYDLEYISLYVLVGVTAYLLLRGLLSRPNMLKFPFLASAVVAGWFIPQAIGLVDDPRLPQGGFVLTMMMASLCLLATVLGEKSTRPKPNILIARYDRRQLLIGAAVLSAVGLAAFNLILRTPAQVNDAGLTTGVVTILFFFSTLKFFGLAIALLLLLERFSWPALVIVAVDLNAIASFVLFGGRRGPAVEAFLIVACALWFQRRFILPRTVLIVAVVVASFLGNSIGEYRRLVTSINEYRTGEEARLPGIDEILQIDFLDDFGRVLESGSYEARNAVMYIAGSQETGQFDFGTGYWNYLVFRYVPGQLVGFNIKQGLMFDLPDNSVDAFRYERHIGTSFTGFADAFISFWFFGVVVFAGIAALLTRWWDRAMVGAFEAKLFYCLSIVTAIQSVSHGTQWFLALLPQLFIFTIPILIWARRGYTPASSTPYRPPAQVFRGRRTRHTSQRLNTMQSQSRSPVR